jgi:hypothetical protein
MKRNVSALIFATALSTMALASPALAAKKTFLMEPTPLDMTAELVVGVVNVCTSTAGFKVTLRNALTGAVLKQQAGTIAAGKGAAVFYHSGSSDYDAVFAVVQVGCKGKGKRVSSPVIGGSVRDFGTKTLNALLQFEIQD